jgi:transcription elongation factor GreB
MTSSASPRNSCITPEGMQKLQAELEQLWNVERRKVTREVSDAAAQGDRSENAEYIYGKKRLREIDRRVRFLRQRIISWWSCAPARSPTRTGSSSGRG